MLIGRRIRQFREERRLSQGDIEAKTGLMRCYLSRVENGHTVPSIETLERLAAALEIPVYRFFYDGETEPETPNLVVRKSLEQLAIEEGESGSQARFLLKLKDLIRRMGEADREILLFMARKLSAR